jgi:hypothetical protein
VETFDTSEWRVSSELVAVRALLVPGWHLASAVQDQVDTEQGGNCYQDSLELLLDDTNLLQHLECSTDAIRDSEQFLEALAINFLWDSGITMEQARSPGGRIARRPFNNVFLCWGA